MDLAAYQNREQTAVKHQILRKYLSAFTPIVGNWASDIAYIDCLAGPWESVDPNLKDTSFAQAIDVLNEAREMLAQRGKFPTMRCLLIEREGASFDKLNMYCEKTSGVETLARNWDLSAHISDVVRFAKERHKSFPFIFLDPKGWETLEIDLISPILALDPGEVLITFMTSFIARFLTDETKRFDRLFGADLPRLVTLQGEEREEELVHSYVNMVRNAGRFKYVCSLPVMKSNQDAFQFHMIYATRHPRGVEVFKATERNVIPFMHQTRANAQHRRRLEHSGQLTMLDPEAQYREQKFTRFRSKRLEIAKCELRGMLESAGEVLFDDAWAAVMQHSTVMEADLGQWLNEWKTTGLLRITNELPRQKMPRKKHHQYLKWLGDQNQVSPRKKR
jgi:three-Cys-motif partner protein